jgi:hypothetical protein
LKTCFNCKLTKPIDSFYNDKRSNDGKAGGCKKCREKRALELKFKDHDKHKRRLRNNRLKMRYGLTLDEFNQMLQSQGNCCAICMTVTPNGVGFVVDHNHETGKTRGILCPLCNKGLGYFGDTPEKFERAYTYIKNNH